MRGTICAFTGATLWGLSGVCADFLMSNYAVTPLFLTFVRLICAALLFGGVLAWGYREEVGKILADKDSVRGLLIFGGIGLFLCQITYIVTINLTNAGTATVMQSLNIVFTPLVAFFAWKQKLAWQEILGVVLAFFSILSIATQGNIGVLAMPLAGLIWGLACGCSETFYVMYPANLFKKWGSLVVTGLGMIICLFVCGAFWFGSVIIDGSLMAGTAIPVVDFAGVLAFLAVGVLGTFVAFGLFLHGVSLIGPVRGNMLGAMEPASAAILSAVWLGTAFTGWDWLGLFLMLATIFTIALKPQK